MLTIRLQRGGKRNTPQYKVVLAQKTAANQKQFVEILGAYNPHTKELVIRNQERLDYWMNEQHTPLSATVHNLFVTKELLKADKKHAFAIPKKEVAAASGGEEASAATEGAVESENAEEVIAVEEVASEVPETATEQSPAEEVVAEVEPPTEEKAE